MERSRHCATPAVAVATDVLHISTGGFPSTGFQALAVAIAMTRLAGVPPPTVFGYGACAPCIKFYDCDGRNSSDSGSLREEGHGINGYHPFAREAEVYVLTWR